MSLADLPDSHHEKATVPCDWCGQSDVSLKKPPGRVTLTATPVERSQTPHSFRFLGDYRDWCICAECLDILVRLVRWRAHPDKPYMPLESA